MPDLRARIALTSVLFLAFTVNVLASERVALVVGNSNYEVAPLTNPINDAKAMAELLGQAGFAVTKQIDTSRGQLQAAVDRFGLAIRDPKVKFGVFYYAGHGLQQDWRNYLVPVSAKIRSATDVPAQTVDVSHLLQYMEQANGRSFLVILDACREDPFAGVYRPPAKGLSQFDAPVGSLLAYATAPGAVARDGEGKNGLYTGYLLREFAVKGVKLEDAFKRVRLNVRLASKGAQVPWESTSLEEDLYLFPSPTRSLSEADRDELLEREMNAWRLVKSTTDPELLAGFVRQYPSGSASELAQARLNRLLAAMIAQEVERDRLAAEEAAKANQELLAREKAARLHAAKAEAARMAAQKAELERVRLAQIEAEKVEAQRQQAAKEAAALAELARKAAESERLAQEELRRVAKHQKAVKLAEAEAEQERAERARLESQRQKESALLAAAEVARLAQERLQRDNEARQQTEKLAAVKAEADRIAERARQSELQAQRAKAELERLRVLQAQQEADERTRAAQAEAARAKAERLALAQKWEEAARLDAIRLAQQAQAAKVQSQVALAPTPYFKGYDEHWRPYSLGDEFHMRVVDRYTGAEKPLVMKVTQVDAEGGQVVYNGGEFVSDMMGNTTTNFRGSFSTPRQFYPAELLVGKKWQTRFKQSRPNGITYTFQYNLKVVGKERITVPAGTFDAYKIEARGFNVELSAYLERNIWVTPGVNSDIAHEILVRLRNGTVEQHDRQELVSYVQAK